MIETVIEHPRQSALHSRHVAAGAELVPISGWSLPARYPQEPESMGLAAGISDASYLTKLDLRGDARDLPLAAPARLWPLTPSRALITSPAPIAFAPSASVTEVTSIYSAILLVGSKSRDILARLTTLNARADAMPAGAARQGRIAHVNAMLLRLDGAGDAGSTNAGFLVLNTRDLAEHVWDALLDAGSDFGITPFGVQAQQTWLGAV